MPDLSGVSKQDILRYLSSFPGAVAFEGNEQGGRKYTDDALKFTWSSAMKNPAYDEEIERALLASKNQLGESAMQRYQGSVEGIIPKLKFLQEITQGPARPNLGSFGKRMKTAAE